MLFINRSKSRLVMMLALVMFVLTAALPVYAADSSTKLEIRLKLASNQMKINGEATKIQPPYKSSNEVMVPLSVFTNAKSFAAKVQLKDNKIITLTYLKHVIVMTIGSKAATIDGKKVTLSEAPVNKSGVTMVPLAIIAKTFGATQSNDAATKEIVLKATITSAGSGSKGPGIDTDSGKSKIGDSYYTWSMNYPTGLVQQKQWSNGNFLSFSDVKGNYYLAISIEEAEEALDSNEKRDWIKENIEDETVVDVKTITRPTGKFERIVTKDQGGFYYEYRGIQANGYFYTLIFGKKASKASELDANAALLDSFQPVYNAANKSLKDLARIKDGKISFENSDYGLKLQLSKQWSEDSRSANPYYYGPDDSSLSLDVYSLNSDDNLSKWVGSYTQFFKELKAEAYRKEPEISSVTWNGIPATVVKLSYSDNTKQWLNEYQIYAIKGQYKYAVNFTYKEGSRDGVEDVINEVLNGMKIDFAKVEKSFGEVPDPMDSLDLTSTTTKKSKKFNYSVTVPKYWISGTIDMDKNSVNFSHLATDLAIAVNQGSGLKEYQDYFEKANQNSGIFNMDSKTNVTFAGVNAVKYEFSTNNLAQYGLKLTVYIFESNGNLYAVQGTMNITYATESNLKRLDEALNSFQLTK
ncbi:copper amine oxidase N-terminal domain-containing protein [Cohnella abietis]|uniref:Copper amine oxidase-like N-terminal domain-containing protein n=1 Tax=Cohnella abietis TaxID=2507935 RepID=A0A3T1DDI8_9BACL|nr:copper amine oxidase N-terminal domain-containing protein [Cohnella abietis]BBI36094.1 hypothetical protein KCTCHS21_54930 [Cohnella abietis]